MALQFNESLRKSINITVTTCVVCRSKQTNVTVTSVVDVQLNSIDCYSFVSFSSARVKASFCVFLFGFRLQLVFIFIKMKVKVISRSANDYIRETNHDIHKGKVSREKFRIYLNQTFFYF